MYKNAFGTEHLYIPHGSDERENEKKEEAKGNDFISHMVQMKDANGRLRWV